MKEIWSLARKELRSYFRSSVALLFLAVFLVVTLFAFFWVDKFFARNLADIRPLFEWMPLLLAFLAGAITMRSWSEETNSGTVELLFTMPVSTTKLVLGKFLACMVLVGIALVLTMGVPITVSSMGDLDWGPVWGGYWASFLLAGLYLSIGLCISAVTTSQIAALIGSTAVCAVLYFIGSDAIVGGRSESWASFLAAVCSKNHFASIERGVLDLRDVSYFIGGTAFFLALNVFVLLRKSWSHSERTVSKRRAAVRNTGLVFVNAILLVAWLAPVTSARVDLTKDNRFGLSEATKKVLQELPEPLVIKGYFSGKSHPLLAPLVPQIRDLLQEYQIEGSSNTTVTFIDPQTDDAIAAEADEKYGIRQVPLPFEDKHGQQIVNTYFHLLVGYGDQNEILSIEDLIDIKVRGVGTVKVSLKNLEYDITRAIRKVSAEYNSADNLFVSLSQPAQVTGFVTPNALPKEWSELPDLLQKAADEIKQEAGDKFSYEQVVPNTEAMQRELVEKYGFKPFVTFGSPTPFYMYLLVKIGDRLASVEIPPNPTQATIKDSILEGIKRVAPGFTKVVGLVTPPPKPPNQQLPPQFQRPQRPPQSFRLLEQTLSQTYEVQAVNLSEGNVPSEVEVLIVAGPDSLDETSQKAADQFLMRGGSLVVLSGRYRLAGGNDLSVEQVSSGLGKLLSSYGVTQSSDLLLDEVNDSIPVPVMRNIGGRQIRQFVRLAYPFFVKVENKNMAEGSVITSSLNKTVLHWASPLSVDTSKNENRDVTILMSSSAGSWLQKGANVAPDFARFPQKGFGKPDVVDNSDAEDTSASLYKSPHVLAVAVSGTFDSAFASDASGAGGESGTAGDSAKQERLLARSTPDARLVVIGSSNFVEDQVLQLTSQFGGQKVADNISFVQNIVDWSVEDTDLLEIRARSGAGKTLDIDEADHTKWELGNYAIALLGLGGVAALGRRRREQDIVVEESTQTSNKEAA